MTGRVLAVRLDSDGDVLLTGPALRSLAATADGLDLLASPAGRAAGELLPGVDEVLVFDAPWSGYRPAPVDATAVQGLVSTLAGRRYDRCVVFTSFHQSPLPMALLARLAGIGVVAATSVDYPGSLLDVRHRRPDGLHEVEAALDLALAAGGAPVEARLAVRGPLEDPAPLLAAAAGPGAAGVRAPYVVVHPGASVPARAAAPEHARGIAAALAEHWTVVVTGGPGERDLGAFVAGDHALDLSGRTTLAGLAGLLAGAAAVVVGNTGPAHLAAAVGTPVVSLFSPVVPADRWAPWGVPTVLLGDQGAACAATRARECPVAGHPCLSAVAPSEVVEAARSLAAGRARAVAAARPAGGEVTA